MKRVVEVSEASHKSLLQPWRTRRVWVLRLACGHVEWRLKSRFRSPPTRVKCHKCESEKVLEEVESC